MPVAQIIVTGEAASYLGITDEKDLAWVDVLRRRSESAVRRYIGSSIIQATHTHYFPQANPFDIRDNQFAVSRRQVRQQRLPEWPVRDSNATDDDGNALSNPRVWEDEDGHFGQNAASTFPNSSELTYGQDYYLEVTRAGLSTSGNLIRRTLNWYARPGSTKVLYTAGWSRKELTGDVTDPNLDASDISLAVLKTVAEMHNDRVSKQGGGGGIVQESLGEYSYRLDQSISGSTVMLTDEVKMLLDPFKRMAIL